MFLLRIFQDGVPGSMIGPITWERGVELIQRELAEQGEGLTEEELEVLEEEGYWELPNGDTLYIVDADADNED